MRAGHFVALIVRDLLRLTVSGSPSMSMGRFAWWDVRPTCAVSCAYTKMDASLCEPHVEPGSDGLLRAKRPGGLVSRLRRRPAATRYMAFIRMTMALLIAHHGRPLYGFGQGTGFT